MKRIIRSFADTLHMYGVLIQHAKLLSLLALLLYTLKGLLLPLNAIFMAKLAQRLGDNIGTSAVVAALVAGIATMNVIRTVFDALTDYINVIIQQRIELPMRIELQSISSQHDCRWHEKQEFAQMLEMSGEAVKPNNITSILKHIPSIVTYLISFCASVILLAQAQWYLPITAALFAITQALLMRIGNRYGNKAIQAGSYDRIAAQELFEQQLEQTKNEELRIFAKSEWMIEAWKQAYGKVQKRVFRTKDLTDLLYSLHDFSKAAFSFLMIGLFALTNRSNEPDNVVLVITAYATLSGALSSITNCFRFIDLYSVQVSNYFKLVRAPVAKKRNEGSNTEPVRIELDHVTFAYDDEHDVLHGISFHIKPGEKIALVGENGSGKTTLAKLLLQFYTPREGSVRICDSTGEIDCCRGSVILQDYMKYQLAIRDCIGLGDISKLEDGEALRHAYRSVCGNELPFALEEVVGKQFGTRDLSVGEWQKLAVARAFVRSAPLIVLDEPNASIDAFAEAAMIRRMFEEALGRTCIFITHRLTTTALADRIVVLKNGRICEQGTHEELMKLNGEYARMYGIQAEMYA